VLVVHFFSRQLGQFNKCFFQGLTHQRVCHPALLSDSTLPQYEVYKKLVWERGWGGGGKSDEDVYEVIIMDDSLHKILPDLVIFVLIEIEGVQWLETAT
jgi:hypothetical protein